MSVPHLLDRILSFIDPDRNANGDIIRSYGANSIATNSATSRGWSGPLVFDGDACIMCNPSSGFTGPKISVNTKWGSRLLGGTTSAEGYGQFYDVDVANKQVFAITDDNTTVNAEVTRITYDAQGQISATSALTWVPAATFVGCAVVVDTAARKGYFIGIVNGVTLYWRRYDLAAFALDNSGTIALTNTPGANGKIIGMAYVSTGKVALAFADNGGALVTVIISGLNGGAPVIDNEQRDTAASTWLNASLAGVALNSSASTLLVWGPYAQVEVLTATPWTKTVRTAIADWPLANNANTGRTGLLAIPRGRDQKLASDDVVYFVITSAADVNGTALPIVAPVRIVKWNWSTRTILAEVSVSPPISRGVPRSPNQSLPWAVAVGGTGASLGTCWGLDGSYIYLLLGMGSDLATISTGVGTVIWRIPRF